MPFLKQRGLSVISSKDQNRVGRKVYNEKIFFFFLKGLTKLVLNSSWVGILGLGAILVFWLCGCGGGMGRRGGWNFLGLE